MAKKRYRVRNSVQYNENLVQRGSITFWFDEEAIKEWHKLKQASHRGRPQIYRDDTQQVCAMRWYIEQFHRELKQLTEVGKCECRKQRIQRNHIACAILGSVDISTMLGVKP